MNYNQYGGDRPILRERNNNLEKFATTYVNALSKDNKEQRKKVVKIEDFDPVIRTENINSIGQLLNMKASKLFQNVFQFRPNGKLILSDKSSIKIDNARQLWEQSSPQTQCKNVIEKFDIKTTNCYICGLPIREEDPTKTTTDCEHILPIAHAVVLLDLYKGSEKDVVSNLMKMEYEWSHTCCNMIKSETSFIRFNEGKEKKNQPPFEFNDQVLHQIYNGSKNEHCSKFQDNFVQKLQNYKIDQKLIFSNKKNFVDKRKDALMHGKVGEIIRWLNNQYTSEMKKLFMLSYITAASSGINKDWLFSMQGVIDTPIEYAKDVVAREKVINELVNSYENKVINVKNTSATNSVNRIITELNNSLDLQLLKNEHPIKSILISIIQEDEDTNMAYIDALNSITNDDTEIDPENYFKYKLVLTFNEKIEEKTKDIRGRTKASVDSILKLDLPIISENVLKEITVNHKKRHEFIKNNPTMKKGEEVLPENDLKLQKYGRMILNPLPSEPDSNSKDEISMDTGDEMSWLISTLEAIDTSSEGSKPENIQQEDDLDFIPNLTEGQITHLRLLCDDGITLEQIVKHYERICKSDKSRKSGREGEQVLHYNPRNSGGRKYRSKKQRRYHQRTLKNNKVRVLKISK